jgi:hypothetical protein
MITKSNKSGAHVDGFALTVNATDKINETFLLAF